MSRDVYDWSQATDAFCETLIALRDQLEGHAVEIEKMDSAIGFLRDLDALAFDKGGIDEWIGGWDNIRDNIRSWWY